MDMRTSEEGILLTPVSRLLTPSITPFPPTTPAAMDGADRRLEN